MKTTPSRPFVLGFLLALLVILLSPNRHALAEPSADLEYLQGHWEGQGPGGPCTLTISGSSLRYAQPAKDGGEVFWYETTFTLPADTEPPQLHATILDNHWPEPTDIGKVIVTLYKFEDGKLILGVVDDFEGPLTTPVVADWNRPMDLFHLERARPVAAEATAH